MAVLPSLPLLTLFNVADDLGRRRILSRLLLFPAGVIFIFGASIVLIQAFPTVFLPNAHELDIIWGLLIVWLGYAVARKKGAFVIRAARENFLAWCYGTFMMGIVFGALWLNYFSTRDLVVLQIYSTVMNATGYYLTVQATTYALGLALTLAGASAVAYLVMLPASSILGRHRTEVKWVAGSILGLIGAYFIFNDVWAILRIAGLVL